MSQCSATQQGDEMYCARCALRWPVADVDPPRCMLHERRCVPRGQGLPPVPVRPMLAPSSLPARVGAMAYTARGVDLAALELSDAEFAYVTRPAEEMFVGGALPGRESARRAALAAAGLHDRVPGVDYAALLGKYLAHVGACAGSDFVESRPGRFTPDELRALQVARQN